MKLMGFLATIVVGAALAPLAFAAAQKPPTSGVACKPKVSLIVVGTATADATATQVSLKVTGGNRFARPLFAQSQATELMVTTAAGTQITTSGGAHIALTAVDKGDRVLTQYRVCKADLSKDASTLEAMLTSLSPKKVVELG